MKTPTERVQLGIQWLDRHDIPAWRSTIKLEDLRFANPDKGPLGQLFGDYLTGLKKLGIIGGGDNLGFRTMYKKPGDAAELKAAWNQALKTEPSWTKLGDGITRRIKGVRFTIYWDWARTNKPVQVVMSRKGVAQPFSRSYCSYDSAKRAVRNLIQKNGV